MTQVIFHAPRPFPALTSFVLSALVFSSHLACSEAAPTQTTGDGDGDGDGEEQTEGSGGNPDQAGSGGAPAGSGGAEVGGPVAHDFFVLDNAQNLLVYLSETEPDSGFSIAVPPGSRDVSLLDSTVLVSHGDGAGEYSLESHTLTWSVDGFPMVETAQRLANGNTLLGLSGADATFHEVSEDGDVVATRVVPGVSELRLARVLPSGNVLFTGTQAGFHVLEMDETGSIVWSAPLPGKGYRAERLPNGNTLATTGETVTAVEISADGAVVSTRGGAATFPDAELLWFSGFDVLPSGNVLVANWHGHGFENSMGPHLVEFSPNNEIVWEYHSVSLATVTNVLVVQ